MESPKLDRLDRRILHALSLEPRAPFSRIAAVLGGADRTIAYRYRRLRASGLRVIAVPDARSHGQRNWLVRLRCSPAAATALALALARRADTSWVAVAAGGTEVGCFAKTNTGGETQLLEKLSRTPGVESIDAYCVLRDIAGINGWRGRVSALTAQEISTFTPKRAETDKPPSVTAKDGALLRALATDGRTSYPALAKITGWAESTARRRLAELSDSGLLQFHVDIDPAWLGYPCTAILWLTVTPGDIIAVAETLDRQYEVAYAAATTGTANIAAIVVTRDLDGLYDYVTTRLGTLSGISRVEITPLTQQIKRTGELIGNR